jgi:hypothetical protein
MERLMFRVLMAAIFAAGLLALAPGAKTFAQDKQSKKSICEFGADDQKLKGAERKKFMSRCMAKDDAPEKKAKPKPKAKPKATPQNEQEKDG